MICKKHGTHSTFCKFCDAEFIDAEQNKPSIKMVSVSEEALESIKRMAQKTLEERDRCIALLEEIVAMYHAPFHWETLRDLVKGMEREIEAIAKVEQERPVFDNPKISG